ncbi:unnamed protein product [Auanema sp. JU1783]|nr:unnamed protein product [Auanema sp. JU1783]
MWRRLTIPLVLFVCFIPTSVNYPIIVEGAYFRYLNASDRYITIGNARERVQPFLVPFMVVVTIVNVMLNTAAMMKLVMHRTAGTKKSETNLLIMSLLNFIIQALAAVITVNGANLREDSNRNEDQNKDNKTVFVLTTTTVQRVAVT